MSDRNIQARQHLAAIERVAILERDNARLREALRQIAENRGDPPTFPGGYLCENVCGCQYVAGGALEPAP